MQQTGLAHTRERTIGGPAMPTRVALLDAPSAGAGAGAGAVPARVHGSAVIAAPCLRPRLLVDASANLFYATASSRP
jgi:hypothetical protein